MEHQLQVLDPLTYIWAEMSGYDIQKKGITKHIRVITGRILSKGRWESGAQPAVNEPPFLHSQQSFTCKSIVRISQRVQFRDHKPKAARTSEHPTLTVIRALSASTRQGLTSC